MVIAVFVDVFISPTVVYRHQIRFTYFAVSASEWKCEDEAKQVLLLARL